MEDSFLTHEALELKVLESDIQRVAGICIPLAKRLAAAEDCLLDYQREVAGLASLNLQRYRDGPDDEVSMSYANRAIGNLKHLSELVAAYPKQACDAHLALGSAHLEKMRREGKRADAIAAELYFRKALDYTEEGMDKKLDAAIELSSSIRFQFLWTEDLDKLNEALALIKQHITQCPINHEARPQLLRQGSELLLLRADFTGCIDDVESALQMIQTGLSQSTSESATNSDLLLTQATALQLRFEGYEKRKDLLTALSLLRPEMIPPRVFPHARQEFIVRLLDLLCVQNAYDKSVESLMSAKKYLSLLLDEHVHQSSRFLRLVTFGCCAKVYLRSYLQGLNSDDLNLAFANSKNCCKIVKTWSLDWNGYAVEAEYDKLCGIIQGFRYLRYGAPSVLEQAIEDLLNSVKATSTSSGRLSERIGLLCDALHRKYKNHPEESILRDSKHWLDVSSKSPPSLRAVDSARIMLLQGQIEYEAHCLAGTALEGLEVAIKSIQSAQTATCRKDVRRQAETLLVSLHIRRGELSKKRDDYAAAESIFRTMSEKPDPPVTLGDMLWIRLQRDRYELCGDARFGRAWLAANRGILESGGFRAESKLDLIFSTARLEFRLNSDREAAKMWLLKGLEVLEEIIFLADSRQDQLSSIRRYGAYPYMVVRALISQQGAGEEAVQVLERGRNLIWNGVLKPKMPIAALEKRYPEHGARFRTIRNQLLQKDNTHMLYHDVPHDILHIRSEFQKLVIEIRRLNGFDNFLLTPSVALGELCQYAVDGPAVITVPAVGQLDNGLALIVEKDRRPRIVYLPLLKEQDCRIMALRFRRALDLEMRASELPLPASVATEEAHAVLKWLWDVAAEPILDSLGFHGNTDSRADLPRMWWVTSGWTNVLPIHAAGDFAKAASTKKPQVVADRVLSSYTPTLKALWHAREQTKRLQRSTRTEPRTAMLVAMKETPHNVVGPIYGPLEHAEDEINVIHSLLKPHITIQRPSPRFKQVIESLKSCTMAHFVCRGTADAQDPLRSRLLLMDHSPRPLSVDALMQTDFDMCRLAYLSACSTAVSIERDVQEEALHLCAAFQMAGVPQVVGSWWEIEDKISLDAAERFYTGLVHNEVLDISRAPLCLHQTIYEIRIKGLSPVLWGAYVHFGA